MNEQFPGTSSGTSGSWAVPPSGPHSQMRETEALGGPLAFPARVTELGAAPRNADSGAWWNNRGIQAASQCGWNVSSSYYKASKAMSKISREHTHPFFSR